jgi:hypothetical protein
VVADLFEGAVFLILYLDPPRLMSNFLTNLSGIPRDTSPAAFRVQCQIVGRLSPSERLQMAFDLTRFAEEIAQGGIRRRHPNYSAEQVRWAIRRMRLGSNLFRKVYPHVEVDL